MKVIYEFNPLDDDKYEQINVDMLIDDLTEIVNDSRIKNIG